MSDAAKRPEADRPGTAAQTEQSGFPPLDASGTAVGEIEMLRQDASALGVELPAHALDQLVRYLGLLRKWNAAYNLTAVRDPAQMRLQHVVDCLAVVEPLRRRSGGHALRILDVGSGGGLPGVVLAVAEPRWDVSCVDTVGKKAAFVRQAAGELVVANLHALHARVEALPGPRFDVITSRAFAPLSD